MKARLAAFGGWAAPGCEIVPVASAPKESPGVRYWDCDREAEEYCEEVVELTARDMDACVAEYRFTCSSSGSVPFSVPSS